MREDGSNAEVIPVSRVTAPELLKSISPVPRALLCCNVTPPLLAMRMPPEKSLVELLMTRVPTPLCITVPDPEILPFNVSVVKESGAKYALPTPAVTSLDMTMDAVVRSWQPPEIVNGQLVAPRLAFAEIETGLTEDRIVPPV